MRIFLRRLVQIKIDTSIQSWLIFKVASFPFRKLQLNFLTKQFIPNGKQTNFEMLAYLFNKFIYLV